MDVFVKCYSKNNWLFQGINSDSNADLSALLAQMRGGGEQVSRDAWGWTGNLMRKYLKIFQSHSVDELVNINDESLKPEVQRHGA